MSVFRNHHHIMAATFLLCGGFLMMIGFWYKSDYCLHLTTTDPPVILNSFAVPSNSSSKGLAKTTLFVISFEMMTLALIPWYLYKSYPSYRKFFLSRKMRNPSESVMAIIAKHDLKVILTEYRNLIVYLTLSILLALNIYQPESLLQMGFTPYSVGNDNSYKCVSGFGAFIWFKSVLQMILLITLIMAAISVLNIYKEYLDFLEHRRMALATRRMGSGPEQGGDRMELRLIRLHGNPPPPQE